MSGRVCYPPVAFNVFEVTSFLDILGTLKHHVLEQVGKPSATFDLIARAYVVIDGNCNNRCGVVFRQHDPKPVLERKLGERYFKRLALRGRLWGK